MKKIGNRSDIVDVLKNIFNLFFPKTVDPLFISSTTTGTIAEGTTSIYVVNRGGATGTVTSNGSTYTLAANEAIELYPRLNRLNGKITFDGTGTTLKFIVYR